MNPKKLRCLILPFVTFSTATAQLTHYEQLILKNGVRLGPAPADGEEIAITNAYTDPTSGVTHIYLQSNGSFLFCPVLNNGILK